MASDRSEVSGAQVGMKTDSLKLICQLSLLKHLHRVGFKLEYSLGDKSGGKNFYLRGIQGEVTRPVWNRDYLYLNSFIQQVREYLQENSVHAVLNDLFFLALDIFNRYDNRRRMGVELMILCMLSSPSQTRWEIPDKYQAQYFILDMLVSCRQRFQKPNAAAFWSKQSESLLISTFKHSWKLSRLVLSLCNDLILRAISVYCRNLSELEVQLAQDVTEEGLLAIAGRSIKQSDQGFNGPWENALYLQKDFGAPREWYIKDSMLFTPPCLAKRPFPPKQCEKLIKTFPTSFGCTKLRKFRLFGDIVFPPLVSRAKGNKNVEGPALEVGFYVFLIYLKNLQQFNVGFTPLVLARLAQLLSKEERTKTVLNLTELFLGLEEQLEVSELNELATICPNILELKGVSTAILSDACKRDQHIADGAVCDFLMKFSKLKKLTGNMKLSCFNSFFSQSGQNLTYLNCSTQILDTYDLILLRRYCVCLQKLDGCFSVENTVDRTVIENHTNHNRDIGGTLLNIDSPWTYWKLEVLKYPWKSLRHLDLTGRINLKILQILVASADLLETLSVKNLPNEMVSGGMAFDDTWISGLIEANSLQNLREFTIRMDSDHFVEEGFLTKSSLNVLLQHAVLQCPKLENIVGEWTKIPDKEISLCEDDAAIKGLNVKIRNAKPYRDFQNIDDNDRFYGMNEGYWRLSSSGSRQFPPNNPQIEGAVAADNQAGVDGITSEKIQIRHQREWGYVYRPFRTEPEAESNE